MYFSSATVLKSGTVNKILKIFSGVNCPPPPYIPQTHQACCQNLFAFFPKAWMAFTSMRSLVITPSVVEESQNYLVSLLHFHDKDGRQWDRQENLLFMAIFPVRQREVMAIAVTSDRWAEDTHCISLLQEQSICK